MPDDGLYEAQLSNCANNNGATPCFTNNKRLADDDTYFVQTSLGDLSKIIG